MGCESCVSRVTTPVVLLPLVNWRIRERYGYVKIKGNLGSLDSSRMIISITYILTKFCISRSGNSFGKNTTCVFSTHHYNSLRGFEA